VPAGGIALIAAASAWAAAPLEAGANRIGATFVGADASVLGGVDTWTDGGGAGLMGQLSLGGSWTRGAWARAARVGSWVEAVPGAAFDGHLGALQLRHRSGLGLVAVGTGSVSVGWGQGAALASADAPIGALTVTGSAGPVGRGGWGGAGAGGMGSAGLSVAHGWLRPALELRGTAWAVGALPALAQAALSVRVQPLEALALTPSASVLATGAGQAVPVAGLPAGGSQVARVGLGAELALGRTIRVLADAAWEAGPGYQRAVAFGGLAAQLGRVRSTGCAGVAAGTVVFRLPAPGANEVAVSGSFTGWAPQPMARDGDAWLIGLPLSAGTYEYVYLVDGVALVPPEAALTRPDGWGGTNGVLEVTAGPCER
jgi:hypothetical protein